MRDFANLLCKDDPADEAPAILCSCADRVYVGVEELQREAKRGFWCDKPATSEEGSECLSA